MTNEVQTIYDAGRTIQNANVQGSIIIRGADGRDLLAIHPDGTVTGTAEDANEAATRFFEHLRGLAGAPQRIAGVLAWFEEKGDWMTPDEEYVRGILTGALNENGETDDQS